MLDDELREKFLSSEDIYSGKIIRVQKWQVALPNGETAPREVVRHNGASAIAHAERPPKPLFLCDLATDLIL